eukprot:gene25711-34661_t
MRNNSTHHCDGGCRAIALLILLGSAVIVAGQQSGDPAGTLLLPSHARNKAVGTIGVRSSDGGAHIARKRRWDGITTCQDPRTRETYDCCVGGYYHAFGRCYECRPGSYKRDAGNRACTSDPDCWPGQYRYGGSSTSPATCGWCPTGQYSISLNVGRCTECPKSCNGGQYLTDGYCGFFTNNKRCIDCINTVCPPNQYRSGTCDSSGRSSGGTGFQCNQCDNLDCSAQGDHMYRAGTCGGQATPIVNGYTCDTHEPCPDIDTFYLPSDDTHRTCPRCPAGQHQPVADHRELECIDTTTST